MTDRTIALVTGANRGLGYTTVRRLAALGWTVWLGARDEVRGTQAAAELADHDVRPVPIDVTDDASVDAAAATVARTCGRLDVLVNNAGIMGPNWQAVDASVDDIRTTYETNVFGVIRVTRAFLPLLDASPAPRVVMVTSGIGSHAFTDDPVQRERVASYGLTAGSFGLSYPSSKAALNMIGHQYARALPRMRVNIVDPGFTATAINDDLGTQTLEEGTDAVLAMAQVRPDGPTGTLVDRHGPQGW